MNDKAVKNREEFGRSTQPSLVKPLSFRFQLPQPSWLHAFVLVQFLLQILLLFPEISAYRIVMRVGAFALSLGLLLKIRKPGSQHPAKPWAIAVLGIMAMQLFWHPYLSSVPAGLAQCLMYLAILAPLFWVSRLDLKERDFCGLIYLIWGFHTLSSIAGVLQVYYPEVFQFAVSSVIENGVYGGDQLKITLANGQLIYRPAGLTDIPGGAATSGFYTLLLGTGIALQQRHLIFRALGLASIPTGLFCIYLSQMRSTLICALVCWVAIALILVQLKQFWKVAAMVCAAGFILAVTTSWAANVGGDMMNDRFLALLSDRPDTVIYQNRGIFLDETINGLIPQFPLGAGLGRWGMMNAYFGDHSNPITAPLWAEIQWTGWVLDGGIPLVLAYLGALVGACLGTWRVVYDRRSSLQLWGVIVLS
ncbi:MAG TPA: hypothetical protein VL134_06965, partial [Leptolyngbya sp.]|nr:hypothetical protein [Leptolyngbya sp.]